MLLSDWPVSGHQAGGRALMVANKIRRGKPFIELGGEMSSNYQADPFNKFMNEVRDKKVAMRWRSGQALFNHLLETKPHLAEQIRATELDPFFKSEDHPTYKEAIKWVREHWEDVQK